MTNSLSKSYLAVFLLMMSFNAFSQANVNPENKGKFYALWGWNWSSYSKSDIHFAGNNYDFVLASVSAHDHQTPFSFEDYFGITSFTIPQTNLRFGYFITDNLNLAIGVDHMKYFVTIDQTVKIDGSIATGGVFDGNYNNDDIVLSSDFLQYEHSDGLNYINAEINYVKDILSWTGQPKEKLQVYAIGGFGAGFLLPKTNSKLMGWQRHDDFNVAGYGMALKAGVNITFFKYFFVQTELKGGYINMPNIRTTPDLSDGANQHFSYLMTDVLFGAIFKIANKK